MLNVREWKQGDLWWVTTVRDLKEAMNEEACATAFQAAGAG